MSAALSAVTALAAAGAVAAAERSGLLAAVELHAPTSPGELAARTHLDPAAVRLMVDALTELGVVEPVEGRADVDGAVRLVGAAAGWATLLDAGEQMYALLEGRPPCATSSRPMAYRETVAVLAPLTRAAIAPWARIRARPGLRVLEVGCGDAPWTRALLAAEPFVHATLQDHPEVLERTTQRLAADPSAGATFELLPGDAHVIDLGGPYDLIIVGNFCRLFDAETNARFFGRLAEASEPGSELLVLDAVEIDDPRELALYRLSLASRRRGGQPHHLNRYRTWFDAAGFGPLEITRSDRPELTLLAAPRRAAGTNEDNTARSTRQD